MSIGEVSFYTGILLFIIGIIGGGIDIKEVKIPEIKGVPRYMCFIGSVLFLVLGLYLKNVIPQITITNAVDSTVVNAPSATVANTPKLPEPVVTTPPTDVTPTTPPASPAISNSTETPDNTAPSAELIADKKAAQSELDEANKRIDVVWNATTKAIRDELSLEQRQWIKKRDNDCVLEAATEEPNVNKQAAVKLRCMAMMSDPRVEELKQKIAAMTAPVSSNIEQPTEAPRIANSIDISVDSDTARNAAQAELNEANKRINLVWNATTKEIRDALLPEQRQWLKKREDDCSLEAVSREPNAKLMEVIKLHCMAAMTDPRTQELAQEIADMTQ